MIEIKRLRTADDIALEAARIAAENIKNALLENQTAVFVLAGGRLPPIAYGILARTYTSAFDWSRLVFAIGDERCVPLNDPDNSWHSAEEMFSIHREIPSDHLLRPDSQLSAEVAAENYEKTLQSLVKNQAGIPILHHLWLGIGEDGHTLSLFPNHQDNKPSDHLVAAVHNSPKPPPDRITLTLRALTGVQSAVAFISGESKAEIIARIAAGDKVLPIVQASQSISEHGGHVTWLVDDAAASHLGDMQLHL